jgi:hypothetical protein
MIFPALFVAFVVLGAKAAPNPQTPRPSNMPKLGQSPVAFGPKPAGCSKFEILVGESFSYAKAWSKANKRLLKHEGQAKEAPLVLL